MVMYLVVDDSLVTATEAAKRTNRVTQVARKNVDLMETNSMRQSKDHRPDVYIQ